MYHSIQQKNSRVFFPNILKSILDIKDIKIWIKKKIDIKKLVQI